MIEWSNEDIKEVLEKEGTAVLYFYTPLCGTCQVAGKMISIVEHMIEGIPFGKTDLNYYPDMAALFLLKVFPAC